MKALWAATILLVAGCSSPRSASSPTAVAGASQSTLPMATGCESSPSPVGQSRRILAKTSAVGERTLAFVRGGGIFLLTLGEQPALLAENVDADYVSWSRDARHLAYVGCDGELRIIDLASHTDRTVLLGMSGNQQSPDFASDGRRLYGVAVTSPDPSQATLLDVAVGVNISEATSSQRRRLVQVDVPIPPAFLPRGAGYPALYRAVRGSRSGIEAAWTAATNPPEFVVFGPDGHVRVRRNSDSPPAWNPNQDQLVFSTERGLILLDLASGDERVLDAVGGTLPVWSPDGRRVAYTRIASSPELYIVDLNTRAVTRLVEEPAAFPSWSADGQWIAYARQAPTDGRPDLWEDLGLSMVRADGSAKPLRLTPDDGSSAPVFAPLASQP